MKLIYDYMRDKTLRHELNKLTNATFGFDFESWVVEGYFEGDYIPYSLEEDGEILANVSANKMCFMQNGIQKNYIQIGTVMTDKAHRMQGLAKRLIKYVLKEYEGKCDGIYLFGDLGALPFYRKMGFEEGLQYQYLLREDAPKGLKSKKAFQKVDGQNEQIKRKYMNAVRNSAINSAMEQMNKYGLWMFYTANLSTVYYAEDINCYAVMEKRGDTIILQSIVSQTPISLKTVLEHIDLEYNRLKLGFTPCHEDEYLFEMVAFNGGDDYRFFYLGDELKSIEKEKLFFPLLSHA